MGCCCSCTSKENDGDDNNAAATELADVSYTISRAMSAPSIDVDGLTVTGYGLALASVSLEQDAGYWEIHVINIPDEIGRIYVGVSPKRDRQFFADGVKSEGFWTNSDNETNINGTMKDGTPEEDDPHPPGTELMKRLAVTANDIIGIAMQQSDLPMLQFTLNGAPLTDGSINRFRGNPYPAVYLPDDNSGTVRFVFRDCQHCPPNARFVPIMEARGLV